MNITTIEKRELDVTELFIDQDVTLVYMPDLNLCDFHVKADKRYLVHFLNPATFGLELATIHQGNNVFNMVKNEKTPCYLFDEAQMRNILKEAEGPEITPMMQSIRPQSGTPSVCTPPIIIPPTRSTG